MCIRDSIQTGLALAPGINGTSVQQEVNTLANMLAACINSNGAETGGATPTSCYQLLITGTQAYGNAGSTATDTATEAIYIAHNPSYNTALYNLGFASGPFQTALTTQPNDWTIAITYGIAPANDGATDLAIDATGNLWITNNDPCSSGPPPNNTPIYCITEMGPQGQQLSGPTGYIDPSLNQPYGIAIDTNTPGNIWIANNNTDTNSPSGTAITELTPATSTTVTANGFANTTLEEPWGIAVDGYTSGIWVTDIPVSYTHLDVYKRQLSWWSINVDSLSRQKAVAQQYVHDGQSIQPRSHVVDHDAGAFRKTFEAPDRGRLRDIERSKKYKAQQQRFPRHGNPDQCDELSGDFVNHHKLRILEAGRPGDPSGGSNACRDRQSRKPHDNRRLHTRRDPA